MVYPHLVCKVDSRRTGWWPSGGWIRRGLRQFSKAAGQLHVLSRKKLRNEFRFQPPSVNGRFLKLTGNVPWLSSWRIAAGFNRHFLKGWL